MDVFLTGATGFVGTAIAKELGNRGHRVVALARSERAMSVLRGVGLDVHRGDIAEPQSLVPALDGVDAVIHTAFNHDFSRYVENCEADRRLLDVLSRALVDSDKVLIATSGTTVAAPDGLATENDIGAEQIPRSASEAFLNYAARRVRTGVVRLPPTVYGRGDTAFVPTLIALARKHGVSGYVDDGTNRWPAVHRDDAARLFCDIVERPKAGARYHAVAEEGIAFRTIAETIARGLGLPAESLPMDRAEEHFGWLAMFATLDASASGEWTRATTGWTPRESGLVETMQNAGYFDS